MSLPLLVGTVAALALVLTALLTPLVRGAALGMGLVRQAQADRWHRRPTPAIGGVAIYLGFGIALGVGYLLAPGVASALAYVPPQAVLRWTPFEGLLFAGTLVFLVGLVDDLVHLSPVQKLAGQVAAAVLLVLSGVGVWLTGHYLVDAALSVLWFVAMTNAMNLLDNMDGLAAGVSAIAGVYLSVIFVLDGEWGLVLLSLAFTASLLGFLAHNYPPARIFMGDSGSLFLGLFLAGLSLSPAPGLSRSLFAVVAAPALVLAIPILDTTLVTVGRMLEGRPISQGGKDHTSHRLVALGVSEERALWILWTLAIVGGAISLLLRTVERGTAYALGGILVAGLILMGSYLLSVRFHTLRGEGGEKVRLFALLTTLNGRFPVLTFAMDALLVALAYYGAYVIRWEAGELGAELPYFRHSVAVVVAAKLVAFAASGVYGSRWQQFSLDDGIRVIRASFMGTLIAAVTLLLVDRIGLSRGVMAVDFLTCTILVMGARLSFRFLEGATRRWSRDGLPAVVLGPVEDADMAVKELRRFRVPALRVVAVADPEVPRLRSRLGAYPLYGGRAALENALHDNRAHAVVLVCRDRGRRRDDPDPDGEATLSVRSMRSGPGTARAPRPPREGDGGWAPGPPGGRRRLPEERLPSIVKAYLASHGGVDVYELRVVLTRVERVRSRDETFAGVR